MDKHLSIDLDSIDPEEPGQGAEQGEWRGFSRRKRNRHGRGRRGPMLDARLPGARTREEHFEDLLVESAERLADRWGDRVTAIDFRLMLVPNAKVLAKVQATGSRVPWATSRPGRPGRPERITVYRRPIEQACPVPAELAEFVHMAVVEQLAELWAMDPQDIDPGYRGWGNGFGD
ncbi:metallopeptidase family protein [Paeniglutamicibacter sp. NPDC012692]|uniref:metallopeptidase family protein n=1 Tax=Paeniglutamicibacter sp. NPDC012692 TaxID=3364388 RepID=UPI0036A21A28